MQVRLGTTTRGAWHDGIGMAMNGNLRINYEVLSDKSDTVDNRRITIQFDGMRERLSILAAIMGAVSVDQVTEPKARAEIIELCVYMEKLLKMIKAGVTP